MMLLKKLFAALGLATLASRRLGDGMKPRGLREERESGRAGVHPDRDRPEGGPASRAKVSSGTFEFQRPGKFSSTTSSPCPEHRGRRRDALALRRRPEPGLSAQVIAGPGSTPGR